MAVALQVVGVAIMKDGKVEIEAKGVEAGHIAVEVDVGLVVVEVLVIGQGGTRQRRGKYKSSRVVVKI